MSPSKDVQWFIVVYWQTFRENVSVNVTAILHYSVLWYMVVNCLHISCGFVESELFGTLNCRLTQLGPQMLLSFWSVKKIILMYRFLLTGDSTVKVLCQVPSSCDFSELVTSGEIFIISTLRDVYCWLITNCGLYINDRLNYIFHSRCTYFVRNSRLRTRICKFLTICLPGIMKDLTQITCRR